MSLVEENIGGGKVPETEGEDLMRGEAVEENKQKGQPEAVEENRQEGQPEGAGCRKQLVDPPWIGILGLLVAIVGAVAALLVVPEVRRLVGWDRTPIAERMSTPAAAPTPEIIITEVYNAGRAEHVVIYNASAADVDLSGWKLEESDHNVDPFTFPAGFILPPGAQVRVCSGEEGKEENPPSSLSWTSTSIWNNDGETARLYDAKGNLVYEYQY
jgi:Lamin Tail Domain